MRIPLGLGGVIAAATGDQGTDQPERREQMETLEEAAAGSAREQGSAGEQRYASGGAGHLDAMMSRSGARQQVGLHKKPHATAPADRG